MKRTSGSTTRARAKAGKFLGVGGLEAVEADGVEDLQAEAALLCGVHAAGL
jgi:hypothetical protein